jgi:phosphoribosylaminoimidazolecarboxamide formyltransferase/IMP cyclohydrolase
MRSQHRAEEKRESARGGAAIGTCAGATRPEARRGGLLVQTGDTLNVAASDLKVVTRRAPTAGELADLLFAWRIAKFVKSNAIVYCRDGQTLGIGAGQMSRVDFGTHRRDQGAHRGARPCGVGGGIGCILSIPRRPRCRRRKWRGRGDSAGGSVRDAEVIAAADERGIAMVFTSIRHFRH